MLNDGTIYTWGMNDRCQMGVGSGNGLDMVESESVPRMLSFSTAFPEGHVEEEPVIIRQVNCGQNTMIMKDIQNRIFKTGLKIDYTPKLVRFDSNLLTGANIEHIDCGRRHYVVADSDQNLHVHGKIIGSSHDALGTHDNFDVYDANKLFDNGRIKQLSMQYEIYGVLVEHQ